MKSTKRLHATSNRKLSTRNTHSFPAFLLLLMTAPFIASQAATTSFDTLHINTIGGQPAPQGIQFSSAVFFTSGSSITLTGSGGYIITASSINASAFFGDGSHLSNIAPILSATQTFTGADTFTSSFTVQSQGRQIILSTSPTIGNISISSLGTVSFYPELHTSSSTSLSQYQTTSTNFGPCVTGSTLTITTSGDPAEIYFLGTLSNSNGPASTQFGINFLLDGNFTLPLSATAGFTTNISEFQPRTVTIDYLINALPTGLHSFCLTIAGPSGGTTTLEPGPGNIFYIKEIK